MICSKLKYILTVAVAAAALLWGCDGDGGQCPSGGNTGSGADSGTILFRSSAEGPGGFARAVSDFPNGTIGVTATYIGSEDDWTLYGDIQNSPATVIGEDAGVFTFEFDTVKYWPFDGRQLVFAAYSPHTSRSDALELYNDNTHLVITLEQDMPDVLYATENSNLQGFDKGDATADLGTFNHALSELTINVAPDPASSNPGIRIADLSVRTSRPRAILDLLAGDDDNLEFIVTPDFTYTILENASQSFTQQNPYTHTVLLFPGTATETYITVTFTDSTYSYTGTYRLSDILFDKADPGDPDEFLTLVRAANTVVNFRVKSTSVQQPGDGIVLQGVLSDWLPVQDLEVTIN